MNIDDSEEREQFSRFSRETQKYIVDALDFGLPRRTREQRMADHPVPLFMLREDLYLHVPAIREEMADRGQLERDFRYWPQVQRCLAFDLTFPEMGRISAIRFLHERLFGPPLRPWITSLYLGEISCPRYDPDWKAQCLASVSRYDLDVHDDGSPALFFPGRADLNG